MLHDAKVTWLDPALNAGAASIQANRKFVKWSTITNLVSSRAQMLYAAHVLAYGIFNLISIHMECQLLTRSLGEKPRS